MLTFLRWVRRAGGGVWEFVGFADGKLSGVGVEFGRADERREEKRESESEFLSLRW